MIRIGYDEYLHGNEVRRCTVRAGTVLGFVWHGEAWRQEAKSITAHGVVAVVLQDDPDTGGRPVLVPVQGSKFNIVSDQPLPRGGAI